jgi:uncharacterized membrane protein SpoIIM required for sporulation
MIRQFVAEIFRAISRARISIIIVAITYLLSLSVGIAMVHLGGEYALNFRDQLVGEAQSGSILTQATPLSIAFADFLGNLRGAVADALGGLGVVFSFPLIANRGWVGGIVSVDSSHLSRLVTPASAAYYVSVVVMQLTGYTLAAGAGINAGLSFWRTRPEYAEKKWLGISVEAFRDLGRIFLLVVPILLIASLWEFLSPWN